jgi:hypothetical protein
MMMTMMMIEVMAMMMVMMFGLSGVVSLLDSYLLACMF